MIGHPLQLGVTVLVIMAMCGIAGRMMDIHPTAAAWTFFAAFFLMVFGVLISSYVGGGSTYRRRRYE